MASPPPVTGGLTSPSIIGTVVPTEAAGATTTTIMEASSEQGGATEGIHFSVLRSPSLESRPGPSSIGFQASSSSANNSGNVTAGPSGTASASAASSATGATTAASAKKKKDGAGGPPKSKAYANPLASRADEIKYRTKYKQLRGKVKEVEEENAKMQAKILRTKRQIQRLRLERSILYDRFQEAKNAGTLENTNIPVTSLQAQLSSVPYSMNGSTSMHHHISPSHHHQSHVLSSPQQQHHQPPSYHHNMSQGYHPSQFTTHPSFLHDNSDSLMITALQHDMQDPTLSLTL